MSSLLQTHLHLLEKKEVEQLHMLHKKEVEQFKSWRRVVENGELSHESYREMFELATDRMLNFINNEITAIGAQDVFNKHYQYYHDQDLNFVELSYVWIRSQTEDYSQRMQQFRQVCDNLPPLKFYKDKTLFCSQTQQRIVEKFEQLFEDGEIVVYQSGKFQIITIDALCDIITANKYVIIDQESDTPTRYYEDRHCNDQFSKDIDSLTAYQRQLYADHWRIQSLVQEVGIRTFLNSRLKVLKKVSQIYKDLETHSPAQLLRLEIDSNANQQLRDLEKIDWVRYKALVEFYNEYLVLRELQNQTHKSTPQELVEKFPDLLNNAKHQQVLTDCDKIANSINQPQEQAVK